VWWRGWAVGCGLASVGTMVTITGSRTIAEGRLPVPPPLRDWVADISVGRAVADGPQVLIHPPDGASAVVFRRPGEGLPLLAVGPRTRATYSAGKRAEWVRLRLHPGRARLVFGLPASDLVDRCAPLADLWGLPAAHLSDELVEPARGIDAAVVVERVGELLLGRLAGLAAADVSRSDLVREAALGVRAAGVRATARRLHISERQLRDVFTGAVGVPPKRFARIDRVRGLLDRARPRRWAHLATEAGYTDQAHLSSDFRDLMGVPPAAFLAGRLPTATPCTG
jgi:AraC-like DNA-binding protein